MRAVVLSGGGGKGAYEVGVWKALRKLKINYDIVTGTSIGALNGALMVQKDYLKTVWLWRNIDFSQIYNVKLKYEYNTQDGKKEIFDMYKKNILENGGMGLQKIEKIINTYINPKKFFSSPINFGLITLNISDFKQLSLKKSDLNNDNLKDYLMASATCFPAFQLKEIDGKKYVDGGYYDNLPINLAIELGADEIIAVDLEAIGLKQLLKKKNVKITYIRPRKRLNSFLIFNKAEARRAMRLGYNDTMKTFDKLDGDKYTFYHHQLHKNYEHLKPAFIAALNNILEVDKKNQSIIDKLFAIASLSKLKNNNDDKKLMKEMNKTIEYLGRLFEIDDAKIYTMSKFNEILFAYIMSTEEMSIPLIEKKIKDNKIAELLNTKFVVKYLYMKILNHTNHDKKQLYKLSLLFPKEFLAALYLSII